MLCKQNATIHFGRVLDVEKEILTKKEEASALVPHFGKSRFFVVFIFAFPLGPGDFFTKIATNAERRDAARAEARGAKIHGFCV